ncbi:hypothetical protein BDY17DRAFT_321194 [Neohortaea acidophila]|uniref:DUF427 domain-containing protein n=1 Tax=Neohortaea acidophila TaxID=245834 RepID=A0A6A6Q266_9PEZI|nr:uncharacterized protein BDY17DRAFT_321194 [Neohortaea acidophila]KAF2486395.1 hypothetical protein BDY17DRAFT_321194 [Neohortaea acidophila]
MQKITGMFHHHHDKDKSGSSHHATASINGTNIADANSYEFVEGTIYFPLSSLKDAESLLVPSNKQYTCPWKGESQYYDLQVGGQTYKDAAWAYPTPLAKAAHIKDHIAFDRSIVKTEKH